MARYLDRFQGVVAQWEHHLLQQLQVCDIRIQPLQPFATRQDYRHAVMDGLHEVVGFHSEYRAGLQRLVASIPP